MYPNIIALMHYFATFIYIGKTIGPNTTIMVISLLENAVMMKLLESIMTSCVAGEDISTYFTPAWPKNKKIGLFLNNLDFKGAFGVEKSIIMESMYFYKQCDGASHYWFFDDVSKTAWNDPDAEKSIPPLLRISRFTRSGNRSDRFGISIFHDKMLQTTFKRVPFDQNNVPGIVKNALSADVLGEYIQNFKELHKGGENPPSKDVNFLEYSDYLLVAGKNYIEALGLQSDAFIFSDRHYSSDPIKISEAVKDSENVKSFIKILKEALNKELPPSKLVYSGYQFQNQTIPEMSKHAIWGLLQISNFRFIEQYLSKINQHPESALQLSKRLEENHIVFVFGSESVCYPSFLIPMCIKAGNVGFLNNLDSDFTPGLRSAFNANSDGIFKVALLDYKSKGRKSDALKFLINKKFEFSKTQKKILMKFVIDTNDTELLLDLIRDTDNDPAIDLHEYQDGRGITFFHGILIEGTRDLKKALRENHSIRKPDDVVKFIPVHYAEDDTETVKSSNDDPLIWDPKYDLFNVTTKSSSKIRKGWDSLMIAAANGDTGIFQELVIRGADPKKYTESSKYVCNNDDEECLCLLEQGKGAISFGKCDNGQSVAKKENGECIISWSM